MNTQYKPRRILAAATAAAMAFAIVPAAAAEPISNGVTSTYDEAYYATVDYYGNLTEGSMVKSYITNGVSTLTDYGQYDEVKNLTNDVEAVSRDGKTTFDFGSSVPSHFYFEGKTTAPFQELPWTLTISYRLNGVPTRAEELYGKTGEVEINVDAIPNGSASEYARNNYTLEAMALFNQDDILSLEAPGAQVQLIGNLRAVLFLALPGEEQHFTIRVGAEDFSFDGMTFLMVPATLSQLSQIADLSDKADDLEDSYNKLNTSLDTLLGALDGMSGSLYATAEGLDELNSARDVISSGKGQVYDDLDGVIASLGDLETSLTPVSGHITYAKDTLTKVKGSLSDLDKTMLEVQGDLKDIKSLLSDLKGDFSDGQNLADDLKTDLNRLDRSISKLKTSLNSVGSMADTAIGQQVVELPTAEGTVKVTVAELQETLGSAAQLYQAYLQAQANQDAPFTGEFSEFITYYLAQKAMAEAAAAGQEITLEQAIAAVSGQSAQLYQLWTMRDEFEQEMASAGTLKSGLSQIASDTSDLLDKLQGFRSSYADDLLEAVLKHGESAAGLGATLADRAGALISEADDLYKVLDEAEPEAQEALSDAAALLDAMTNSLSAMKAFAEDAQALLKESGSLLDEGTRKTLEGLAATLRKAAGSVSSTRDIRSAKDSISDIIEDTWNEYRGETSNLLLMDADAEAVSMTSEQNPSPSSIQVLIRSQEIKEAEQEETEQEENTADKGTFWSRLGQMLSDFWVGLTRIFR